MAKTNGLRNRVAGHNWEREGVKDFLPYYPAVGTSREVSRVRDAEKVDLAHSDELKFGRFPYNVQYKNYSRLVRYPKVLAEIPQIPGVINVLMHKQTEKVGNRFMPVGKYAILTRDDFMKLVKYRAGFDILKEYSEEWSNNPDLREALTKIGL